MSERPDQSRELDESGNRMKTGSGEGLVVRIPVDKIRPNPFQPRKVFDQGALEDLARSIRSDGLNEPILVRKVHDDHTEFLFELIAGERRLKAVKILGEPFIEAIIKDYDDLRTKRVGLIENIQRENLNSVEVAYGIRALKDDYLGGRREQDTVLDEKSVVGTIADEIGKDRKTVERYLRIYEGITAVPEMEVLFKKHPDRISFRDARDYAGVADRLRALKKSNKREYERILKKLARSFSDRRDRESIRKAIGYLQRYFNKDEKGKDPSLLPCKPACNKMLHETADELVLNIEVQKNNGLTVQDISGIEDAVTRFLEKLHSFISPGERDE